MAISFDAASSGANAQGTNTITWNHTNAGGMLVVGYAVRTGADAVTLVATYNGVSMTAVNSNSISAWSTGMCFFILKEASMPTAGTYAIILNNSGAFPVAQIGGGATSWTGVDQTTAAHNYVQTLDHAADSTPTIDVTSATGEVVLDTGWWVGSGSFNCTFNQTQRWDQHDTGGFYRGSVGQSAAGAGTVTMSYSIEPDNAGWSMQGVSLVAVSFDPTQYCGPEMLLSSGGMVGVNHLRT